MPKPCSKPLSTNPFESYRDPVTGQWKVRYPASALSVSPQPVQASNQTGALVISPKPAQKLLPQGKDSPKRTAKRRWEKPTQTQVA